MDSIGGPEITMPRAFLSYDGQILYGIPMAGNTDRRKRIRYRIRLWLLQEIAGCTFPRSTHISPQGKKRERGVSRSEYSISLEEVGELEASAGKKVRKAEKNGDPFLGYSPIYPKEGETCNR